MNQRNRARGLSLWTLIEAMQRRLEHEGLNQDVVDAAVTRGLVELLERPSEPRRVGPLPSLAKA
jgi:hypothetical protein